MKIRNEKMKTSLLMLAMQGALITMATVPVAVHAADNAAATNVPANTVEIGVNHVSDKSAYFGQYTGLNDAAVTGIVNFDISGGNGYGSTTDATRWSITGTDLGTTSRSLNGSVSNQGQWNFGIGYDELRHNITDSYQTPQIGAMGQNVFTFPATFGTINGGTVPAGNASARVLDATQLSTFHTEDVATTRKNISLGAGFSFSPRLAMQVDFNRLDQSGAKLLAVGASGGIANPAGGTWRAEAVNIIMNPTSYQTDTFNLALNWVGDKGHLSAGYYVSLFKDDYDSVSSQNALRNAATFGCASGGSCAYQTTLMSTAPDNSLHQFNLTGGWTKPLRGVISSRADTI